MKEKCFICNSDITILPSTNYCITCSSRFDKQMKFIPSRHNWNLEDFSKSLAKEKKLSRLKHQS